MIAKKKLKEYEIKKKISLEENTKTQRKTIEKPPKERRRKKYLHDSRFNGISLSSDKIAKISLTCSKAAIFMFYF